MTAISEGHGDTALVLLRAGAESDKKDIDGHLALDLAPDKKASLERTCLKSYPFLTSSLCAQVYSFISQACEREGIELEGVE